MADLKVISKKYNDKDILEVENFQSETVESLKGQDISVEGITSKGIANTGAIGNIGNVAISGELSVSGDVKVFENIVDKNGHKRFQEGEIELIEDIPTGITKTYGKWSLSGSHLLIVLGLSFVNNLVVASGQKLADLELPEWVKNKIYNLFGNYVDVKSVSCRASDGTSQSVTAYLNKNPNNAMYIAIGGITFSTDKNARISFDLLIDNESED